jgi:hypothetical protein
MPKILRSGSGLLVIILLIACGSAATPMPREATAPAPATPAVPTPTAVPTANEPAPAETFVQVGSVAQLAGQRGIQGKAIVAGLQTLIIQDFSFDGKGPQADIRLVKGQDYAQPALILLELAARAYDHETLHITIPSSVGPGAADSLAVYCRETGEVYAVGRFE